MATIVDSFYAWRAGILNDQLPGPSRDFASRSRPREYPQRDIAAGSYGLSRNFQQMPE